MGVAHRPGRRRRRAQGLPKVRHKRDRQGRQREDTAEKREGRGRHRGKSLAAGRRADREAARQIRGEDLQSRWLAEDEQQHYGEREEGLHGGSEGSGGSIRPSVLRRAERKRNLLTIDCNNQHCALIKKNIFFFSITLLYIRKSIKVDNFVI